MFTLIIQLASIYATENHPDNRPWREQEDCNQQVKDMVHFLLWTLNNGGLLWCLLPHYHHISVILLLSHWSRGRGCKIGLRRSCRIYRAVEQGDNKAVVVAVQKHIQDYKLEQEQEVELYV